MCVSTILTVRFLPKENVYHALYFPATNFEASRQGPDAGLFLYCPSAQPPEPGGRNASAAGILATTAR
jgi:hypothetical protein